MGPRESRWMPAAISMSPIRNTHDPQDYSGGRGHDPGRERPELRFSRRHWLGGQLQLPSGNRGRRQRQPLCRRYGQRAIRKITSEGVVTTLAGKAGIYGSADGTGTAARFSNPEGIAVDASGTSLCRRYREQYDPKITSEGVVTTLAGTARTYGYADGTGTAALFYSPTWNRGGHQRKYLCRRSGE
jgi:hypothetical protein